MKRWISFLLVLALLLQVPIGTLAAVSDCPTFRVETVNASPGDSGVKVKILIENNPGIASAKLTITYDDAVLDLTNVEYNTQWGGMSQPPQYYKNPLTLNWFNGVANYIQQDSVYATLTFDISNDAVLGTSAISVNYDPEDVYNIAENNVAFDAVNGGIIIGKSATDQPTEPDPEIPTEPAPEDAPVFKVETKNAAPGDANVLVNIWAENNPGIASVKLLVDYDDSQLSLNSVEFNTGWGGMSQLPQTLKNPVTLNWFNGVADYKTEDSVFATLSFSVRDDAQSDLARIKVTYDPEDVYNINEINQEFAIINGGVKVTSLRGDLDNNGSVDDEDVIYLLWHTLMSDEYPVNQNVDFDHNGSVDDEDVIYLLWHTLMSDEYPL